MVVATGPEVVDGVAADVVGATVVAGAVVVASSSFSSRAAT